MATPKPIIQEHTTEASRENERVIEKHMQAGNKLHNSRYLLCHMTEAGTVSLLVSSYDPSPTSKVKIRPNV